ncbi:unnamed protein product [Miscanthus lutarioriparius]|uniref:Uncharacterized protein n=1 Tax=Miscanthus lutarioriparius TaxID=422564 RepID=A0A811MJ80_9POAL|nr:unnamed protein product [Miscanthus lutarioriparius]
MGRRLALLICVALLSAAMANGTRPAAGTVGGAATAPPASPVVATTPTTAGVVRTRRRRRRRTDNKRKVPNGPDPIHNRRARWGEAPSKRV